MTKIITILTGGTICCARFSGYDNVGGENPHLLLDLYRGFTETPAELETREPYRLLSQDLGGDTLSRLAQCIEESLEEGPDGIIVTHGTDSLQYMAAYLGYVFPQSPIPIVLASSNYPLLEEKSNGLANFCGAVDFIREGAGRGVFVSYQNEGEDLFLHRATRLLAHPAYSDRLLSVDDQFYGSMTAKGFVKNPRYQALADAQSAFYPPPVLGEYSQAILRLDPYVGLSYPKNLEGVQAVLHGGYHTGSFRTMGQSVKDFSALAREKNVSVFLAGATQGYTYVNYPEFDELGFSMLPVASPIAMYMKLWLSLTEGRDPQKSLYASLGEDIIA